MQTYLDNYQLGNINYYYNINSLTFVKLKKIIIFTSNIFYMINITINNIQ